MRIPKKVKVGKHTYVIKQPETNPTLCHGTCNYATKTIKVFKTSKFNEKYADKRRAETLWHELTHAILHDMGNKLAHDEKFVSAFANRLNNAIHSAEF